MRTADRERIADLDAIPSPFLTGLFDAYGEVPGSISVVTETNRGCPYSCTFCDWGSATASRIRQFSMDRVLAEIEWCASHGVFCIGPADSNFGIFPRDVDIAEAIAAARRRHGFPKVFGVSYAKNSVKHLQHIIETMAHAGIVTHGILSLQTMDPDTLAVVRRSNIKTEKYDQLAAEFRRARLPLFVDLMLGLPGSTPESFRNDLQACVDREVQVRIPQTTLLVNSPMNDPAYRAEHQIETAEPFTPGVPRLLVSTKTLSRAQRDEAVRLRALFLLFENFGALRQVARFVRQETGLGEVAFYERLRLDTEGDPERWPMLRLLAAAVPTIMSAPGSWGLMIDELRGYLVEAIGVAADDALDTVLAVQLALLPAVDRVLPVTLSLRHDYAAWYQAMLEVKESPARGDWTRVVPRLRELPPATFTVSDPDDGVRRSIGGNLELHGFGLNWEYESPVRRAFSAASEPEGVERPTGVAPREAGSAASPG
ncbi:MAG: radical SAM protein [Candidatus Binatia bacterium]